MEQQIRMYTITASRSQSLLDVHISDDRKRLALAWFQMPVDERQTSYVKIDGGERAILSAGLSTDKRKLIVTVEYDAGQDTRADKIQLPLVDLLTADEKRRVEQCDLQMLVQDARTAVPEPMKVHFCYTQTRHDLNYCGDK
jgi:hypothetical protein